MGILYDLEEIGVRAKQSEDAAWALVRAVEGLLKAHPLPDDLRRVSDKVIAAHDAAEAALKLASRRT